MVPGGVIRGLQHFRHELRCLWNVGDARHGTLEHFGRASRCLRKIGDTRCGIGAFWTCIAVSMERWGPPDIAHWSILDLHRGVCGTLRTPDVAHWSILDVHRGVRGTLGTPDVAHWSIVDVRQGVRGTLGVSDAAF